MPGLPKPHGASVGANLLPHAGFRLDSGIEDGRRARDRKHNFFFPPHQHHPHAAPAQSWRHPRRKEGVQRGRGRRKRSPAPAAEWHSGTWPGLQRRAALSPRRPPANLSRLSPSSPPQGLGWRAATAALLRASQALTEAMRTAPQPAPVSACGGEPSETFDGCGGAEVLGGGYDSEDYECVYDPWSRTWGPKDPDGLGWW